MKISPEQVASEVYEVVPMVTREIREQLRKHRAAELTVAQVRVLAFVDKHPGTSLSDVADHIGLSLPSMSKMIDGLVARELVAREFDHNDRRRMTLHLTGRGHALMMSARQESRAALTATLAGLKNAELEAIYAAMRTLRPLFETPREAALVQQREKVAS